MTVQIPENMMARLGSSPITSGNTNVAPNMATTCWAPSPTVLPHARRWWGATGSPGAGSTTSHLNSDDISAPSLGSRSFGSPPENPQRSDAHLTPSTARSAEGTPVSLAGRGSPTPLVPRGGSTREILESAGDLQHPEGDRNIEAQMGVGRERTEQPLQLGDPVAHRVVVEEQQPGGLGDVEVGVEQHLEGLAEGGGVGGAFGKRAEDVARERAELVG